MAGQERGDDAAVVEGQGSPAAVSGQTPLNLRRWWLKMKTDPASVAAHPGSVLRPQDLERYLLELSAMSQGHGKTSGTLDWPGLQGGLIQSLYRRHKSAAGHALTFLSAVRASIDERIQQLLDYVEETGFIAAAACDPDAAPFTESALTETDLVLQKSFEDACKNFEQLSEESHVECRRLWREKLHRWIDNLEECAHVLSRPTRKPLPITSYLGHPLDSGSATPPSGLWWSLDEEAAPLHWVQTDGAALPQQAEKYQGIWLHFARHAWNWCLQFMQSATAEAILQEEADPLSANWPLSYLFGHDNESPQSQGLAVSWAMLVLRTVIQAGPFQGSAAPAIAGRVLTVMRDYINGETDTAALEAGTESAAVLLTVLLDRLCGMTGQVPESKTLRVWLHEDKVLKKWKFGVEDDGERMKPIEPRLAELLIELALKGRKNFSHAPSVSKLRSAIPEAKDVLILGKKPDGSNNSVAIREGYELIVHYSRAPAPDVLSVAAAPLKSGSKERTQGAKGKAKPKKTRRN